MKKYTAEELEQKLEKYDNWQYDDESAKLTTGFEFENFMQALDFANVVGEIAEDMGHHPDILIHDYKFITIFTATHDANGITDKDFDLIEAIETELESNA
jgi:4a-hydroxytetrahydrobiopterin dehydratase